MSNLACLGFQAGTETEFKDSIMKVVARSREVHRGGGFTHNLWQDKSGAAVGLHLKRGAIDCLTPCFLPLEDATAWYVETQEPAIDPECLDCSGADCNLLEKSGELITRASIQFVFFRPYRNWLSKARRFKLDVAAFAEEFDLYDSEKDFEARHKESSWFAGSDVEFKMAPNCFLPTGMFGDLSEGGMRARARSIFAGKVVRATSRTNTLSGGAFWQLRVESLAGPIDVVHPAKDGFNPAPGQIALIGAWLVGRPVDPPPERPFWARLFGR